jgi:hypothetical protein
MNTSTHSGMMALPSRESASDAPDFTKPVEPTKRTPVRDLVLSSGKGNGKATIPVQHIELDAPRLAVRAWTSGRPNNVAYAPKPRLGQSNFHSSWNDINVKHAKEEWKQTGSWRHSSASGNFSPTQNFSTKQYQHSQLESGAFGAELRHRNPELQKACQIRRRKEAIEAAAGPDSAYRKVVRAWFDGTPRQTDLPTGAFAGWNRQQKTLIITKKSKGNEDECEWTLDNNYKTKYDCGTQDPCLVITKDNNGGAFRIDRSQDGYFEGRRIPRQP